MTAFFYSKYRLLLISSLFVCVQATAQTLNVLPVMLEPNKVTSLPYISVDDQEGMNKVKLQKENYPVIIMQKEIFTEMQAISQERTNLIDKLEKGKSLAESKDTLSQKEINTYIELVDAYKRQLDACDKLNAQLNSSILTMNTNFESVNKIADKNIKKEMWKKAGFGLLGAGIGFSIATLLGAFH